MRSLSRSLSFRLACTLFATMLVIGAWTLASVRGALEGELGIAATNATMKVIGLRFLVGALAGAVVTWVGAGWFARSAVEPVQRIADEARGMTGTATGLRITTHADLVEYADMVDVLNGLLTRVERVRAWHQRVLRDLGHDLRTPITAMRTGAELALWSERSPEEYRQVIRSSLEEAERLTVISDGLMLLGRLESGELVPQLKWMDVGSELRDAAERARPRPARHRLEVTAPSYPVEGLADPVLLGLVLDQLIDNAIRYTPAGTLVRLSTWTQDGATTVVVEDDGPGVPVDMLPHLFEPFYRTDPSRGRAGGPGLGLTVARAIVQLHGGTISARAGRAGGLRVEIGLPGRETAETGKGQREAP